LASSAAFFFASWAALTAFQSIITLININDKEKMMNQLIITSRIWLNEGSITSFSWASTLEILLVISA